jgi:hypothetical protein
VVRPYPLYALFPPSDTPVGLFVAQYAPQLFPLPPAGSVRPGQTVHWNFVESFTINLTLTNMAGHSVTVPLTGEAYMDNFYMAGAPQWYGMPTLRFEDWQRFNLDGQTYTVWGANLPGTPQGSPGYTGALVDVWVGSGAPPMPQWTPEPGTFALVALGLVPFGLRRCWRREDKRE